jgi:hypothetical protein
LQRAAIEFERAGILTNQELNRTHNQRSEIQFQRAGIEFQRAGILTNQGIKLH